MSKDTDKPIRTRTRYTKAKDYRVIYADSAMVRYASAKALTMDFYVGNVDLQDELQTVHPDGKLTDWKLDEKEERGYTREIQVQVVMTPENAEFLAKTLLDRANTFKEQAKG